MWIAYIGVGLFEAIALRSYWMSAGRLASVIVTLGILAAGRQCYRNLPRFCSPVLIYLVLETLLIVYQWEASFIEFATSPELQKLFPVLLGGHAGYWAATTAFWSLLSLQNSGIRFWQAASIGSARLLLLLGVQLFNIAALPVESAPADKWYYWAFMLCICTIAAARLYFQELS